MRSKTPASPLPGGRSAEGRRSPERKEVSYEEEVVAREWTPRLFRASPEARRKAGVYFPPVL